jgi:hypothetical protein
MSPAVEPSEVALVEVGSVEVGLPGSGPGSTSEGGSSRAGREDAQPALRSCRVYYTVTEADDRGLLLRATNQSRDYGGHSDREIEALRRRHGGSAPRT